MFLKIQRSVPHFCRLFVHYVFHSEILCVCVSSFKSDREVYKGESVCVRERERDI